MANQITHIVLAKRIPEVLKKYNEKECIIGTTFPDIRYLGAIDRERTHNLDWIDKDSSFIFGMKYHVLVDEVREKFMSKHTIYSYLPASEYITQALKCYEDELLYHFVGDWETVSNFYTEILPDELDFGIPENALKKWHKMVRDYCAKAPTDESRSRFITGIRSEKVAIEINSLVHQMREIGKIKDVVLRFYKEYPDLINKHVWTRLK